MRTHTYVTTFGLLLLLHIEDIISSRVGRRETWTYQTAEPPQLSDGPLGSSQGQGQGPGQGQGQPLGLETEVTQDEGIYFLNTPTRITVDHGGRAKLECSVQNLGAKKVIWQRQNTLYPLTIERDVFEEDDRLSVEHDYDNYGDWNLVIDNVQPDDEGVYECRVPTRDAKLIRNITLRVLPLRTEKPIPVGTENLEPSINITGKAFVERHQTIRLVCLVIGDIKPHDDIDWFLDGEKLTTKDGKIKIVKNVSIMKNTMNSVLEVIKAEMDDAGFYTCRSSTLDVAYHRVEVLNAGEPPTRTNRGTETGLPLSGRSSGGLAVHLSWTNSQLASLLLGVAIAGCIHLRYSVLWPT